MGCDGHVGMNYKKLKLVSHITCRHCCQIGQASNRQILEKKSAKSSRAFMEIVNKNVPKAKKENYSETLDFSNQIQSDTILNSKHIMLLLRNLV